MKFNMMVPIRIIQGLFALVVISLSGFGMDICRMIAERADEILSLN
jgi:hypothetical protein